MKILGLDVSTRAIGWAICQEGVITSSGYLLAAKSTKKNPVPFIKAQTLHAFNVRAVIGRFAREFGKVYIERSFVKGGDNTRKLCELQGKIRMDAYEHFGTILEEITPAEWRSYVSGKIKAAGSSDKKAIIKLMESLGYSPQNDDEADAMGVALGAWVKETGLDIPSMRRKVA